MLTYRIHFIRHGATQANIDGKYIGRTDLRLSREGIGELESLRRRFDYPGAELVVTSPLSRCVQTADLLYPDAYTEAWEDFTECDFGDFEGKDVAELRNVPAFQEWVASGMTQAPPGGESAESVMSRAVRGLDRLFRRMMDEQIRSAALVTHGGLLSAMLAGMGLPKRGTVAAGHGRGYTVLMTPQLWMRDRAFEIYGVVPYGLPEAGIRMELCEMPEEWRRGERADED